MMWREMFRQAEKWTAITVRGNVGAGGNVSCDSVTGSVFAGESGQL